MLSKGMSESPPPSQTGPDPDLSVLGGGSNWARGQGRTLRTPCGSRAKPWWGAKPPDGKRFSVFEMPLEGSPL